MGQGLWDYAACFDACSDTHTQVLAQVDAAFRGSGSGGMDDEAAAAQVAREGRLWANLFVYALDAGRFEVRPPGARLQTPPGLLHCTFNTAFRRVLRFVPGLLCACHAPSWSFFQALVREHVASNKQRMGHGLLRTSWKHRLLDCLPVVLSLDNHSLYLCTDAGEEASKYKEASK